MSLCPLSEKSTSVHDQAPSSTSPSPKQSQTSLVNADSAEVLDIPNDGERTPTGGKGQETAQTVDDKGQQTEDAQERLSSYPSTPRNLKEANQMNTAISKCLDDCTMSRMIKE